MSTEITVNKGNALQQAILLKSRIEALETTYFFTDLHGYDTKESAYTDSVFNMLFEVEKKLGRVIKELEA
jgi:hypothetical protein